MILLHLVDPDFSFSDDNVEATQIVDKILNLPLGDRIWPNCLGRPIKHSSPVDVEEYARRMHKVIHSDGDQSKSLPAKTVAQRTRSKAVVSGVKTSGSIQTLSSESLDSPRTEQDLEVSSERVYAKGIRTLFKLFIFLFVSMCFSVVLLILLEPFYLVVEFKVPTLKPFEGSSKELFAKRIRGDKASESGGSKSPLLMALDASPDHKRMKHSATGPEFKSKFDVPLVLDGYDPEAQPSEFAHMLDGLLIPQAAEKFSKKDSEFLVDGIAGHAFHVSLFSLRRLSTCFYFDSHLIIQCFYSPCKLL